MRPKQMPGKSGWFELPVLDLERAKHFYHALLGWRFQKLMRSEILNYWMIEVDEAFIGGLRKTPDRERSACAPVIYFYVASLGPKLKAAEVLGARLEGGRVDLGLGRGCFQWLRDLDQNRIAFWSEA